MQELGTFWFNSLFGPLKGSKPCLVKRKCENILKVGISLERVDQTPASKRWLAVSVSVVVVYRGRRRDYRHTTILNCTHVTDQTQFECIGHNNKGNNKFVGAKLSDVRQQRNMHFFFLCWRSTPVQQQQTQARGRELGNGRYLCVNHDRLLVFLDDFFWISL